MQPRKEYEYVERILLAVLRAPGVGQERLCNDVCKDQIEGTMSLNERVVLRVNVPARAVSCEVRVVSCVSVRVPCPLVLCAAR